MKKIILFLLFIVIQFTSIAQEPSLKDRLESVFQHANSAKFKITTGINNIKLCYNINEVSNVQTQVLYSCSKPAKAKKDIDQIFFEINAIEHELNKANCITASNYLKLTKIEYNNALDNLQLGFLAFMSATEQSSISKIKSYMNTGTSHWNISVSNFENAEKHLYRMVDEYLICNNNKEEETSVSPYESCENCESCSETIKFFEEKLKPIDVISELYLNSSWLQKVYLYEHNNNKFVIIDVKKDDSYITKKFIFCNIPINDWNSFKHSTTGTYGKRFQKFIFKHKCYCN